MEAKLITKQLNLQVFQRGGMSREGDQGRRGLLVVRRGRWRLRVREKESEK